MNPRLLFRTSGVAWALGFVCCSPKIAGEGTENDAASDASSTAWSLGGSTESTIEPTSGEITENGSSLENKSSVRTGVDTDTSMPMLGDMGTSGLSCDPFLDQCPPGTKCSLYNPDNSGTWEGYRCQPLTPDPKQLYEQCSIGEGGVDTCDKQLTCWTNGGENGICYGLCIGSLDDPGCIDPLAFCSIFGDGISVCFPTCNPLNNECSAGELCAPNAGFFRCIRDVSDLDGGLYGPCEGADQCQLGLACVESAPIINCDPKFLGCCTPWCDVNQINTCPDDLICAPWWEPGSEQPGTENVGTCSAQ